MNSPIKWNIKKSFDNLENVMNDNFRSSLIEKSSVSNISSSPTKKASLINNYSDSLVRWF